MRDAFGGIVNLVIIVVFLLIVSGYLAFNVNYTKAFRVKNYIITTIEQYEGICEIGSDCDTKIVSYMRNVGYNANDFSMSNYDCKNGYCLQLVCANSSVSSNSDIAQCTSNSDTTSKRGYYRVVTQINIDIPVLNKILPGFRIFQVSGNTKTIDAS